MHVLQIVQALKFWCYPLGENVIYITFRALRPIHLTTYMYDLIIQILQGQILPLNEKWK